MGEYMFCNKCGNEIPDNTKFCSYCGNKISNIKEDNKEIIMVKQKGHGCLVTLLFIIALPTIIGIIIWLIFISFFV